MEWIAERKCRRTVAAVRRYAAFRKNADAICEQSNRETSETQGSFL